MKKEIVVQLYSAFEQAALEVDGVECWSARELQTLLGYSKWENFANVINKAKIACENVGHNVSDHFPDVRKMVSLGSGSVMTHLGLAPVTHNNGGFQSEPAVVLVSECIIPQQ